MGSEDFADMMQVVPGAYFWIGHEGSIPVHNPGYMSAVAWDEPGAGGSMG